MLEQHEAVDWGEGGGFDYPAITDSCTKPEGEASGRSSRPRSRKHHEGWEMLGYMKGGETCGGQERLYIYMCAYILRMMGWRGEEEFSGEGRMLKCF
jgi:hypothetical protein